MTLSLILVVEVLVFTAVALMTVGTMREIERMLTRRRRLGGQDGHGYGPARSVFVRGGVDSAFFRWIGRSTSISDEQERNKLRQSLMLAGIESPDAPVWYVIGRFSLAILLPSLYLLVPFILAKPATGMGVVIWPLIFCGIGLLLPGRILASLAASRQAQLEAEFPDALDLMVVCVEAGLSLDAAFVRVGQEIAESHPKIAREFESVSEQLRAGRARPEALRVMADRTGVTAIKSFIALLIQTEMLGASIAQSLRTFSSEMRATRFIRAEEKAMRIPVLMTIPLVACILPVIVTALLLPAIIDVIRTLMPALAGHHGG